MEASFAEFCGCGTEQADRQTDRQLDGWTPASLNASTLVEQKTNVRDVRVFDSFLELGEFAGRQASVLVVVEALDEMDRALLRELELVLQNRRRLSEANVLSPARQSEPQQWMHASPFIIQQRA